MSGDGKSRIIKPDFRKRDSSLSSEQFHKTKKALLEELEEIRQRLSELEKRTGDGEIESLGRVVGSGETLVRIDSDEDRFLEERRKRLSAEDEAHETRRLLQLIFNLSTNFIYLPIEDLNDGISDVLSIIGQYSNVGRSYVFLLDEAGISMSNSNEWCAPGVESHADRLLDLSDDDFPWLFRKIRNLETVHIPDISKLPPEAAYEREKWERQGIRSLINIPIVHGFAVLGFLGFDNVREPKAWSEDMILLLRMVGEFFASAFVRKKAEEKQAASAARYRSLFDYANDAISLTREGKFFDCNPQMVRLFRCSREEIIGSDAGKFSPEFQPDGRSSKEKGLEKQKSALAGKPQFFEWRYRSGNGSLFDADVSLNRIDLNGEALIQGIVRDVTLRKKWERALKESEEKYRSLFNDSRDAIYITRKDGTFVDINQSFLDLFGLTREEVYKRNVKEGYLDQKDRDELKKVIDEQGFAKDFELKMQKCDGTIMDCFVTVMVKRNENNQVVGYQGIIRDVSATKRAEETIRHMAYHDALTGLPNRILFNDRLELAIATALRNGGTVGVMMLDLDKFKQINDELGHKTGDLLLKAVSARLKNTLRKSDTVARMGGDEFLVILPELVHNYDAGIVAEKIIEVFQWPFKLDAHKVSVTTSVGVAIYPEDARDPETIIKYADIAMYHSKRLGRNKYTRYSPEIADSIKTGKI